MVPTALRRADGIRCPSGAARRDEIIIDVDPLDGDAESDHALLRDAVSAR